MQGSWSTISARCSTCVCPAVALKLVAACESLAAVTPGADEGPLARVPAQVSTQMRCFTVHLPTPGDVANVLLLLAHA